MFLELENSRSYLQFLDLGLNKFVFLILNYEIILYFSPIIHFYLRNSKCAATNFPNKSCNGIMLSRKVISFYLYRPLTNLCCHFPSAVSCWFYLPVVLIVFPVENGACLQRVHSWLEDKTSRL